jgi:hypothetical protein
MYGLEKYMKSAAPGRAAIERKFGLSDDDQQIRRLVIHLDPTITNASQSPEYRAKQAGIFIGFRNDEIANMFSYARVISCASLPRVDRLSGKFENTIRVWVREEDAESASALISQQRWVAKVEPEATHIVRAIPELFRMPDAAFHPSREEARPSLSAG